MLLGNTLDVGGIKDANSSRIFQYWSLFDFHCLTAFRIPKHYILLTTIIKGFVVFKSHFLRLFCFKDAVVIDKSSE